MVKVFISTKFSSKHFVRSFQFKKDKVVINLAIKNMPYTMDVFPGSRAVLSKFLPSIFKCQCFNPKNQSFYKEAKKTEIAHLFEHIILEYMCLEKVEYTDEISYSGKTSWNSKKITGDFKIEIECSVADSFVFLKALAKSIKLMDIILAEGKMCYLKTQRKQTYPATVSFGN